MDLMQRLSNFEKQNIFIKVGVFSLSVFVIFLGSFNNFFIAKATGNYNAISGIGQYDVENIFTPDFNSNDANSGLGQSSISNRGFFMGIFETLVTYYSFSAIDKTNHRLFVSDGGNNRVLVFNLDEDNYPIDDIADYVLGSSSFSSPSSCAPFSYEGEECTFSPAGLAYDENTGFLYVALSESGRVVVFNVNTISNGEPAFAILGSQSFEDFNTYTNSINTLVFPVGLAIKDNYLFVSDTLRNGIVIFDIADIVNGEDAVLVLGQVNFDDSDSGSSSSKMNRPKGLYVWNEFLFVADSGNNRVLVFDVNDISSMENGTEAFYVFGQENLDNNINGTSEQNMWEPTAITVSSNNVLYVSDSKNNRVLGFNQIDEIYSFIHDGEGGLGDGGNEFLAFGDYVLGQKDFFSSEPQTLQKGLAYPSGISSNDNGFLFVNDLLNNRILLFKEQDILNAEIFVDGFIINAFDILGQGSYGFQYGNDFIFNQSLENSGGSMGKIGFSKPKGISIDKTRHRLFVNDTDNLRVLVFQLDNENNLISNEADFILSKNDFYSVISPYPLNSQTVYFAGQNFSVLDEERGLLFVSMPIASRVSVFDVNEIENNEEAIYVLGEKDFVGGGEVIDPAGQIIAPFGLALYQDYLFVSDSTRNKILIFDISSIEDGQSAIKVIGQTNFSDSSNGTSASALNYPLGLEIGDINGVAYLFVADALNDRVLAFDISDIENMPNGALASFVLGQDNFSSIGGTPDNDTLKTPTSISFIPSRNLLAVFESSSGDLPPANLNRITFFDVSNIENGQEAIMVLGQDDFSGGATSNSQSGFNDPSNGFYDSLSDRFFVSDSGNNRILWFDLIKIEEKELAIGEVGTSYEETIPYDNSQGSVEIVLVDGNIPPGLSFLENKIVGTPTTSGVFNFSLKLKDNVSPGYFISNKQNYSIEIIGSSGGNDDQDESSGGGSSGGGSSGGDTSSGEVSNIPPVVSILKPSNNQTFDFGQNILAEANASDLDGTISKVEFFLNGNLIKTFNSSPFIFNFSNLSPEIYSFLVKVYDNNLSYGSDSIYFKVLDQEQNDPCLLNPLSCEILQVDTPPDVCLGSNCLNSLSDQNKKDMQIETFCANGTVFSVILCEIKDSIEFTVNSTNDVSKQIREIIESKNGDFITKTIGITGLVFGLSFSVLPVLFGNPLSFSEIILIPSRLWSLLLSVLGLRKKSRKWGVVYDSVTKRPLDPVFLSLQDMEGKEIASCITDIDGRYGFLVGPGRYRILPKKTNYSFPSLKVVGKTTDEIYNDLYFGYVFEITKDGETVTKNIPMDPIGFDWNEFAKKEESLTSFFSKRDLVLNKITDIIFTIGISISFIAAVSAPTKYNLLILGLYLVLMVFREYGLRQKKTSSVIKKGTHIPIPFSIIRIFDEKTKKEIAQKVSNNIGKFFALVRNGKYYVEIDEKLPNGEYKNIFKSNSFEVKEGVINQTFFV